MVPFGHRVIVALSILACLSVPLRAQTPPSGSFAQGLAFFQQGQFDQAVTALTQAIQEDPRDVKAHYYLGYSYLKKGDLREASLQFYLVDLNKPSPDFRAFAEKLKMKLSPEDQKWVENQLGPVPGHPGPMGPPPRKKIGFGIRPFSGTVIPNFGDFHEQQDSWTFIETQWKLSDPTLHFEAGVPWGEPYFGLTPFMFWDNFEVGFRIKYFFPTSINFTGADNYGYSNSYEGDMDGLSLANVDRFYFPMDPQTRFFLEPLLGLHLLNFKYRISYTNSGGSPSNAIYGFDASGMGLDLGLKAGFSFRTPGGIEISFGGGYEFDQVRNLGGKFYDPTFTSRDGVAGNAVMSYDSYWDRNFIWFLPNDPSQDNKYYSSTSTPQNTRPLVVDFSGIVLDLDVSFTF